MKKNYHTKAVLFFSLVVLPSHSYAGAQRDRVTEVPGAEINADGTIPGTFTITRWDERCPPHPYIFDTSKLPFGVNGEIISEEMVAREITAAMRTWNDIPTSYIYFTLGKPRTIEGGVGFDMTNTISFQRSIDGPGGIFAVADPISFRRNRVLTAGDDLDFDGDSDVFDPNQSDVKICHDFDGDGDTEFPEGSYAAGTIIDADIRLDRDDIYTTTLENVTKDVTDIRATLTHELGHIHGLAHAIHTRRSSTNPENPTMFPFTFTTPQDFRYWRNLSSDDIAWSSFSYPEGSSATGLAALQPGDISFESAFMVLRGRVSISGTPRFSTHIVALSEDDEILATTYGGVPPFDIGQFGLEVARDPSEITLQDTEFVIPVPRNKGPIRLKVEDFDGDPIAPIQTVRRIVTGSLYSSEAIPDTFLCWEGLSTCNAFTARRVFPYFEPTSKLDIDVPRSIQLRTGSTEKTQILSLDSGQFAVRRFPRSSVDELLKAGDMRLAAIRIFTGFSSPIGRASPVPFGKLVIGMGEVHDGDSLSFDVRSIVTLEEHFLGEEDQLAHVPLSFIKQKQIEWALKKNLHSDLFIAVEFTGQASLIGNKDNQEMHSYMGNIDSGAVQLSDSNWFFELDFHEVR